MYEGAGGEAVRLSAITEEPASAIAPAMPRPSPRLAPTMRAVVPDRSLMMRCPPNEFMTSPVRCRGGLARSSEQRGVRTLERFDRASGPTRRQGSRQGVREDLLRAAGHAVEDRLGDRRRSGLRHVEGAGHLGVHGAGQD